MAELPSTEQIEAALEWHRDEVERGGGRPHMIDPEEVVLAAVAEHWLSILRGEGPTVTLTTEPTDRGDVRDARWNRYDRNLLPDGTYALVRIPQAEDTE